MGRRIHSFQKQQELGLDSSWRQILMENGSARGLRQEDRVQGPETVAASQETANNLRQDMYSFHQGRPQTGDQKPVEQKPPGDQKPADPYDYHQGPGKGGADTSKFRQTAKLETTLYDMAEKTLRERAKETKEKVNKDAIYHELNRIMVLNGYDKSNLDGRTNLNDHMLKRSWNNVRKNQEFKLYGEPEDRRNKPKPEEKKEKPKPEEKKDKPKADDKKPAEPPKQNDKAPKPEQQKAADQSQRMPTREEFKAIVAQEIDKKFTFPPLEKGKNYSDFVKEKNPGLPQEKVFEEAKRLKDINGEPNGKPVKIISDADRAKAIEMSLQEYDKQVQAKQRADQEQAQIAKAARDKAAQEQAAIDKANADRAKQQQQQAAADKAKQQPAGKQDPKEKFVVEAP